MGHVYKSSNKNRELKSLASVILERNRKKRLEQGHPWVYASEVASVDGEPQAGGLVDVLNHQGRYLATGYYNPASQIRVRILSQSKLAAMDTAFLPAGSQALCSTGSVSCRVRMLTAWCMGKRISCRG